jgi:hypothetical protein
MNYPKWVKVFQKLDRKRDEHPERTVKEQLSSLQEKLPIKKGDRIAVTVGSRYISNLAAVTRAVIEHLKSMGSRPFLVPAMGSHGGATSEGQKEILEEFGFTEETMDVPILSSMEVVLLGEVEGIPIHFDKNAYESDGIVVINRVKPHQFFKGEIQSGLNKMMALGLGKKAGADTIHRSGRTDHLGQIGDFIRSRTPILFGVAILENSYDETRDVAALTPDRFKEFDQAWVKQSRELIPKIPFRELDMILVDQMGKDISGSGMDTNVIGFTRRTDRSGNVAVPLAVFDLTEKSGGNAIGIGLADFTTNRLVKKIDFRKTYTNVIAAGVYSAGRIPITFDHERDILEVILRKMEMPEKARLVRIRNTLHLEEFFVTEALIPEVGKNEKLSLGGELIETSFDDGGNLILTEEVTRRI